MVYWLLLLFIGVPLVELYLLYQIARLISIGPTILLVIGTGILGTALARWQGRKTLENIQQELRQGSVPSDSLLDGLLILIAGALLITPGVLTDGVGFLLLLPFTRPFVRSYLKTWFRNLVQSGRVQFQSFGFQKAERDRDHTDAGQTEEQDYDIDVTPED